MVLRVKHLDSLWQKSVGLIGKQKIYPIYFTTRWGIHTFGMRSPIDVLILDNNFRVAKLAKHVPPNRIFIWNPYHSRVVELPASWIEEKNIRIGSQIALQEF